ncbi:glycoside hydrolase family 45 protein, partial [Lactifluus subvellereus]
NGGWQQLAKGNASFTVYSGCQSPACGKVANGFTAAISELTFGANGGLGGGDACGRCFNLTGNYDPYTPSFQVVPTSIVVKATDLCPYRGNEKWCGQSANHQINDHGMSVHFDLCAESGAAKAFFPPSRGALTGIYEEVSCSKWAGNGDGGSLWNGACLAGENAAMWPSTACGNKG